MKPFEIWQAKFVLHDCQDDRPCVVVDKRGADLVGCFPISGQCYSPPCFYLDADDPCFGATGLIKSCYILDVRIFEKRATDLYRKRGELVGDLLDRFREYSGV